MNRISYQLFISSPLQIAYLMIGAASVSDLLFIFTTCVNCIWFFKKIARNKTDSSAHSSFNEPPAATAVVVTHSNHVETLCCVRLNKTLSPRVSPFSDCQVDNTQGFHLRQTTFCVYVCEHVSGRLYVCPCRFLPLIGQCQGDAHNMTQSRISYSPER